MCNDLKITNNCMYSALLCGTLFVQASLPTPDVCDGCNSGRLSIVMI